MDPLRFVHDSEVCQKFVPQDNQRTYFRRGPSKDPSKHLWRRYPCLKQLPQGEVKTEGSPPSAPASTSRHGVDVDGRPKAVLPDVVMEVKVEEASTEEDSRALTRVHRPLSDKAASPRVTSVLGFWGERNRSDIRGSRQREARPSNDLTTLVSSPDPSTMSIASDLSCEFCGKLFPHRGRLRYHLVVVHHLSTRPRH